MLRQQKPRDDGAGLMSDLARARLDRLQGGGFNGMQAGTIGSVLVGCIALGFFFGQWLDSRAHTNYWMPVMTLVGIAAGFRHMFFTIKQVTEHTKTQQAERNATRRAEAASGASTVSVSSSKAETGVAELKTEDETRVRPRIFTVPPPPQSSFSGGATTTSHMSTHVANKAEEDRRELTERLLDLNDDPDLNDDRPSSQ